MNQFDVEVVDLSHAVPHRAKREKHQLDWIKRHEDLAGPELNRRLVRILQPEHLLALDVDKIESVDQMFMQQAKANAEPIERFGGQGHHHNGAFGLS